MASLSFCSFACSTGSGNRSSRQTPTSGITRSPSASRVRLAVTKSDGALGNRIVRAARLGRSDLTRSRPRSSTRASGRLTAPPSSGEAAGSAPRKQGVVATSTPSTTRLFNETWCPPNRQPHDRGDSDVRGWRQSSRNQPHRGPLLSRSLLMDGEAAVVGRGVDQATAFVIGRVVGRNHSLADAALVGVEAVQPRTGRLGHPACHLAGSGYVVADTAQVGHSGNVTRGGDRVGTTLPLAE